MGGIDGMRRMFFVLLFMFFVGAVQGEAPVTVVSISPQEFQVTPGQVFALNVTVTPGEEVYGAQFEIHFNPQVFEGVGSVEQGDFLKSEGANTVAIVKSIDNDKGIVEYGETTLGPGGVSSPGVLARVLFRVKEDAVVGESHVFRLVNTLLTAEREGTAQEIAVQVQNATATLSTTSTVPSVEIQAEKETKASLSEELRQRLEGARADEMIPVIAQVKAGGSPQNIVDLSSYLKKNNALDIKPLEIADAVAFRATPAVIDAVSALPYVTHIELDNRVAVQGESGLEEKSTGEAAKTPAFQIVTAVAVFLGVSEYLRRKR
jgi:hypothetical protein